ncbi:tyrosine-type recombinase/integrase [Nocardia sp. CA-119907]|uniref:tyrosine-type recombinase/integrase n=1 Tax=Nocardia sp. CA-119907 TaxID=3239973 RepID=UPI003D97BF90
MSDDLTVALSLIATRLGVSVQHLPTGADSSAKMPTFAEYIAKLRTSLPTTTVKNYASYWRVIETAWATKRLDEPSSTEISELVQQHRSRAVVRSNSRDGRGAATHMVAAFRCIYKHAEADRLISPSDNPAQKVAKPRRLKGSRHALTREQVIEIGQVAATTGNDTELDSLIVRIHIEAACRRAGALNLEVSDLEPQDCLIRLREKGETVRWQPISPLLMGKLVEHVDRRGGEGATSRVLRYRNGRPITARRYDYLSGRIRAHLPWAARLQVSAHWIRHTTLTYVEREFNEAIARAYAGHAQVGNGGATPIYTRASIVEVAEALVALTGQPHPLARAVRHPLAPRGPGGCNL